MKLSRDMLKGSVRVFYVILSVLFIRLFVVYSIPWWEIIIPSLILIGIINMLRVYSLTDGMLHQMLREKLGDLKDFGNKLNKTYLEYEYDMKLDDADPITDKVLNHTHKKSNKRYKVKKKRTRRKN